MSIFSKKTKVPERWLNYVDFLNEETRKYSGNPSLSLEERHFSFMEEDAKRIVRETGVSIKDAEIVAVVTFRQCLRAQAGVIPHLENSLTIEYLDETAMKLLKTMSDAAFLLMLKCIQPGFIDE